MGGLLFRTLETARGSFKVRIPPALAGVHFKAFLPEQTWLAWHPARRRKKYEGHQHNLPLPGCCCLVDGGSPSSFLPEKPISLFLFLLLLLLPLGEDSMEEGL